MNYFLVMGQVKRIFEATYTPKGVCVLSMLVRTTSEGLKTVHMLKVWGKLAERIAGGGVRVGDTVVVTGHLHSGKYEKAGKTVYTYEPWAREVKRLGVEKNFEDVGKAEDESEVPF